MSFHSNVPTESLVVKTLLVPAPFSKYKSESNFRVGVPPPVDKSALNPKVGCDVSICKYHTEGILTNEQKITLWRCSLSPFDGGVDWAG